MNTKTARQIKTMPDFEHAALFELSTPFAGFTFVIASGVNQPFAHEVMLFGSNADGTGPRIDLDALRGPDDWADIFQEIGYQITDPA